MTQPDTPLTRLQALLPAALEAARLLPAPPADFSGCWWPVGILRALEEALSYVPLAEAQGQTGEATMSPGVPEPRFSLGQLVRVYRERTHVWNGKQNVALPEMQRWEPMPYRITRIAQVHYPTHTYCTYWVEPASEPFPTLGFGAGVGEWQLQPWPPEPDVADQPSVPAVTCTPGEPERRLAATPREEPQP